MDPRYWLFRHFPTRESLQSSKLLSWLGPLLHAHHLWHRSRRGVAIGASLGIFIGLLIPIAQIPIAGGLAIALRANLPAAIAATFVSNPVTTPVLYYGAYHLGAWVTGEKNLPKPLPTAAEKSAESRGTFHHYFRQIKGLGLPILVGLGMISTLSGLISYFGVHWLWRWRILAKRRRLRIRPT